MSRRCKSLRAMVKAVGSPGRRTLLQLVLIPVLLLALLSVILAQHQRPHGLRLTSPRHVKRDVTASRGRKVYGVRGNGYGVGRNGNVGRTLSSVKNQNQKVIGKDVTKMAPIPDLMEGDVNLPEVLYRSVLVMKQLSGGRLLDLGEGATGKFTSKVAQKAVSSLRHGFGYITLDLEAYEYHLSFLSQRRLARAPRPRRCSACFPTRWTPPVSPRGVCGGTAPITMMILITTTPPEREERMALRETWLTHARNNTGSVRYLFLIGGGWTEAQMNALRLEGGRYGDLLVEDYADTYYNLAYKVVSGLRWTVDHCSRAQFVVRTAADNYLHLPRIQGYLKANRAELDNVQIGRCIGKTRPNRTPWARHYQTVKDYPQSEYSPYCIGTTFVFAMPAARRLLRTVPQVPFFNIEDIWVGLVMEQAGLGTRNVAGFNVQYYPSPDVKQHLAWRRELGVCKFDPNMLSLHRVTPADIRIVHKQCIPKQTMGQGISKPMMGQGIHKQTMSQGVPKQMMGQGIPKQMMGQGIPKQMMGQGIPKPTMGQGVPKQMMGKGIPKQTMGQGIPKQMMGQGISKQMMGQGIPKQMMGQGIPKQTMGQGIPKQMMGQGIPKQMMGQGIPKQTMGQGIPTQMMGQGIPKQRIRRGIPKQIIGQGIPKQMMGQGIPNQRIRRGIPKQMMGQGISKQMMGQGIPKQTMGQRRRKK